ncbi:HTH domain-containing protein [Microbacterium caowuchunii]|uniref:HTH domain-containing protein n=1 Tax=Microbacterium caowuchunii TaxID=2614638 RepID=A0A5N0TGN1_9MICO|nr:HTH domain-containing protein [Microbacterium caowuchunii]KAA9133741.1 HTH domain-containing protein [Microbacterium caowuchunii]
MANLVTISTAAERLGKSERSIWRYVQQLEDEGQAVIYRVPGLVKSAIDYDLVAAVALSQKRGNPRHREARESRKL